MQANMHHARDKASKADRQARHAKAQGKQSAKSKRARKPKRKPKSRILNGVTTVVTLKIGASMHDAKARVHQSKAGHY